MQAQTAPGAFDSTNGNFNSGFSNVPTPSNGIPDSNNDGNFSSGQSNGNFSMNGVSAMGQGCMGQGQFVGMLDSGQAAFNSLPGQPNFGNMNNPTMQQQQFIAQSTMSSPMGQNGMQSADQCQEFLATGRCSAGDHCRFLHGAQAPSNQISNGWQPPPKRSRKELDELKARILAKLAELGLGSGAQQQQMQTQMQPQMQQMQMQQGPGKGRLPPQHQNEASRPAFKARICRHFQDGRCEYGSECSFAHGQHELGKPNPPLNGMNSQMMQSNMLALQDSSQQLQNTPQKTQMCLMFKQKGGCTAGANCMFAHDEQELLSSNSNASPCPEYAKGACTAGDSCTLSHDVRHLSGYKKMLCKRYLRGGCVLGEQCGFAHGEQELRRDQAPPPMNTPLPSELEIRSSIQFGEYKSKLCQLYLRGQCPSSATCMSAHGYNELVSYKNALCETLIDTGKCSMGTNCPNAHSETELSYYKTQLCSDFTAGDCVAGERCSSAHGQQELRPALEERVINMWRRTCATMGGQASALMNS